MSHDLRPARQVPAGHDPFDALDADLRVSPSALLDRVWRFFISMRTGLALMLGLGVLTLIGTLLKQAPEGVAADPAAYAAWLDSVRADYGGWTSVLDRLGFFSMWTSWLFKGLLVLLTTSLLACSINRAPRLWRHATRPRLQMADSFYEHATLRGEVRSTGEPEQAAAAAVRVLRHHHYRTLAAPSEGDERYLYAERFRFGPFGTVISHIAFVVILLGAFLSATTGFKDSQFAVPVGTSVEVGHGTGLAVEAVAFSDAYYPDGSPKDYASELVVTKNGREVQRQTVRVNQPLRVDGVTFYQSFFGTAQDLTVADASGAVVFDQGVPLIWQSTDGAHVVGDFPLPEQQVRVAVVSPASGEVDSAIKAGQVEIQVQRDGEAEPVVQVVDQGQPTEIAGLTFTFQRTRQFTGLIAARDPGAAVVWLGSIALVLGMFMVFFFPHRRIWIHIRPQDGGSRINLGSMLRRDVTFEARFRQISDEIELAASRPSPTGK